jgi:hypothetical protein
MQNKIRVFYIKVAWNKFSARIALYRIKGKKNAKVINILTLLISMKRYDVPFYMCTSYHGAGAVVAAGVVN